MTVREEQFQVWFKIIVHACCTIPLGILVMLILATKLSDWLGPLFQ